MTRKEFMAEVKRDMRTKAFAKMQYERLIASVLKQQKENANVCR